MKNSLNYAACVAEALRRKGLAENDFENTTMRVYHRNVANPATIFKALKKGGIIIPLVDGRLFGTEVAEPTATILLAAGENGDTVTLYDPFARQECQRSVDEFVGAWTAAEGGKCTTAFEADGTYMPKLLDLSHIELPDDMGELMEAMAENAHDMWALERQSEGWTYGPERNDQRLETPDMVPYAQLDDSEREYDRVMAKDTLRLLTALGYKIVRHE